MNRSLPISLAVLQSLVLQGADFTADELRQRLDKIRMVELQVPSDLPDFPRLGVFRKWCEKCGKEMILREEPGLMMALVNRLNEKCPFARFDLDNSSLCPYCGDGRFYLNVKRKSFNPKTGREEWSETSRYPVNRDDLLLLLAVRGNEPAILKESHAGAGRRFFPFREYHIVSFMVKTEEAYHEAFDAFLEGKDVPVPVPEVKVKAKKEREEKKRQAAEIFQRLTSTAHVMRRTELDRYLEKTAELSKMDYSFRGGHSLLLTRMLISPSVSPYVWMPMSCPECSRRYYVVNGANMPILMQPLGDLLETMKRLDILPDYSSLCPYCHPGKEERTLSVRIHAAGQPDLSAEISPLDLAFLAYFTSPDSLSLTENERKRLREILLGEKNDSEFSALPLEPEKK